MLRWRPANPNGEGGLDWLEWNLNHPPVLCQPNIVGEICGKWQSGLQSWCPHSSTHCGNKSSKLGPKPSLPAPTINARPTLFSICWHCMAGETHVTYWQLHSCPFGEKERPSEANPLGLGAYWAALAGGEGEKGTKAQLL